MYNAYFIIAILFSATALLPSLKSKHWLVQVFDYFRFQFLVLQTGLLIAGLFIFQYTPMVISAMLLLLLSALLQIRYVFPFSKFYKQEVKSAKQSNLRIMIANVKQENEEYKAFVNLVTESSPDILITLETNKEWENQIRELEDHYPNTINCPLENRYGLHIYSKLPLNKPEILYLVTDDVPSVRVDVILPDSKKETVFNLNVIHPKPPAPGENETAEEKDIELRKIGAITNNKINTIVCGDFNDVPWSAPVKRFRRASNLNDPRYGRGIYPTFHADFFFARYPLDHLFCSPAFQLNKMKRVKIKGSDHYAMVYDLYLD